MSLKDYMQGWPVELQNAADAAATKYSVPIDFAVKSKALTAPPASPVQFDRYLIYTTTPTGDWTGHGKEIAEYRGTTWQYTLPSEGLLVWVDDENILYAYADGAWVKNPLPVHDLVGSLHTISGATAGQVVKATGATTYALAQLSHTELGGVSADQHHAQVHAIGGADHSGSLAHSALSGIGANDHHNQAHAIDGLDHTGSLAHSALSGITATDHHTNANDPSSTQKNALVGSYGTPDTTNPYLTETDPQVVKATDAVLHVYVDGTLGNDANTGLEYSAGTGGSFSVAGSVVTFTGTGASWSSSDIGRIITIGYATSSANNGSFIIATVPAANQVTYTNAAGVTETMPTTPTAGKWSVSSPKATLQAAFNLVPFYVNHNTCVHLSGTFSAATTSYCEKFVAGGRTLLIDGGTGRTVVADNAGSPWTSDINSVSSIGLTTAGWTVDAYAGYMVEITSSPNTTPPNFVVGQTRLIQGNTATTITPVRNWSVDPGVGATFRIVRPKTQMTAGTLRIRNLGDGTYQFQNLYTSGTTASINIFKSPGYINASHIIVNSSAVFAFYATEVDYFQSFGGVVNPFTFASESGTTNAMVGFGYVYQAPTNLPGAYARTCTFFHLSSSFVWQMYWNKTHIAIDSGTRVRTMLVTGAPTNVGYSSGQSIKCAAGYASTKLNSVFLHNADLGFSSGVEIGPNTSGSGNALQLLRSHARLEGVVGSGSTNFGAFTEGNSLVTLFPVRSSGVGNGTTDNFAQSGTLTTLTIAGATWTTSDIGRVVTISGSTSPGNDGTFIITARPSATKIQYTNVNGVSELLLVGTNWAIGRTTLTGGKGDFSINGMGTGTSFVAGGGNVTLTAKTASFCARDVGKTITITGATTGGNNGAFTIVTVNSPTSVTYANAGGATEAFPGTWVLDDDTWADMQDNGLKAYNEIEATLAKVCLPTAIAF